jgi:uncharacterized membrane protein YqjE
MHENVSIEINEPTTNTLQSLIDGLVILYLTAFLISSICVDVASPPDKQTAFAYKFNASW